MKTEHLHARITIPLSRRQVIQAQGVARRRGFKSTAAYVRRLLQTDLDTDDDQSVPQD